MGKILTEIDNNLQFWISKQQLMVYLD
ncbi:MAG: hypothetical protein RLZZ535_2327, partial [Cyanobacteriota bacterium]